MSFATLRRRALIAAAGTTLAVLAPLGATATGAQAATTAATSSAATSTAATATSASAVAPATKATKKSTKAKKKAKKKPIKHLKKPKKIAKRIMQTKRYRWGKTQWRCLHALWNRESSWRVRAANPYSSAYGIPQALPGHKMGKGWRHSAHTQIRWGLRYIDGRYGTPCGAHHTQMRRGWY
jgi:hypothetical protein